MTTPQISQPHLICINVIEARGLATNKNSNKTANAYCTIAVGPISRIRRATETRQNTVNCVWERTFLLENVMLTPDEFQREKVTLQVYDRNDFTFNTLIGSYEFSLENIYRQKGHEYYRKWVPLALPNDPGREQGYLLSSIYVLKDGDPTPDHEDKDDEAEQEVLPLDPAIQPARKPYHLNVLIYKAQNLVATNSYRGSVSPFVSVRFNGNTQQTKCWSDTPDPTWNVKFEMPFHIPLASDSIEVQVWNRIPLQPDDLIGAETFSYFTLRLTHRSFGPKWINLYSSNYAGPLTTRLGAIVDRAQGAYHSPAHSEYVGRVLLRLSVSAVRNVNPRLSQGPCNPTAEPDPEEYALYFMLYQASEIPVRGGKCRVELAFGKHRISSKRSVIGKEGEYSWREVFEPLEVYCPKDLDQVHDVILNVYHMTGYQTRKIAFERIPVKDLLRESDRQSFFINGDTKYESLFTPWTPRWRSLRHAFPDPSKPHVIAGFLLCSIGFGPKKAAPTRIPKLISPNFAGYTLTVKIHQAANLPAGDKDGSANPFLVIRYAGEVRRLPTVADSVYPFWYQKRTVDVQIDTKHAPSIYIMVYHQGTFGHTLLGRCEVLSEDVIEKVGDAEEGHFYGKLCRFPLFYEEHPDYTEKQLMDAQDRVPYVVAEITLEKQNTDRGTDDDPNERDKWDTREIVKNLRQYACKVEAIGLRKILPPSYSTISHPIIKIDAPGPGFALENRPEMIADLDLNGSKPEGGNLRVFDKFELSDVKLPDANVFGVPLRIRLYDSALTGLKLIGVACEPIANFIYGPFDRPPFYVYKKKAQLEEEVLMDEIKIVEDEKTEEKAPEPKEKEKAKEKEKGKGKPGQEDEKEEEKKEDEEELLDLDVRKANVVEIHATDQAGKGKRNLNQLRKAEMKKVEIKANQDEVREELELRKENVGDVHIYREFILRRGRALPHPELSRAEDVFNPNFFSTRECTALLKAFVRLAAKGKDGKDSNALNHLSDNLLAPLEKIYSDEYCVRVYVYNAVNLTARPRSIASKRQYANPYVAVRAGKEPNQQVSERNNYKKDELNPQFFLSFELQATLPAANELEIAIWDREDGVGKDDLIGATTIDLEWRLLHKLQKGDNPAENMEWRMLYKPGSNISQGKVRCRVDILTVAEARKTKMEDLRPPPLIPYELRMVLWDTRFVRFPEDKDEDRKPNQKIIVTYNFTGDESQEEVKETDTAWDAGAKAEWNWRFKFPVELPCKMPRLKIAIWDDAVTFGASAIGEVLYNLQPLFRRAMREKQTKTHQERKWLPFFHPDYRDKKLGEVNAEFWLVTALDAEQNPVGERQDDPNKDPFLPAPHRKLPPWAVGSKGLEWLQNRKMLIICLCICIVTIPLLVPFLLTQLKGTVF